MPDLIKTAGDRCPVSVSAGRHASTVTLIETHDWIFLIRYIARDAATESYGHVHKFVSVSCADKF